MKNKEKKSERINHLKWFLKSRWTFFSWRMIYNVWPKVRHPLSAVYESKWGSKIRLAWNCLWIRKDEFHKSLSIDEVAMRKMTPKEKSDYLENLLKRRSAAHYRDI
jgi:hypothetical protein